MGYFPPMIDDFMGISLEFAIILPIVACNNLSPRCFCPADFVKDSRFLRARIPLNLAILLFSYIVFLQVPSWVLLSMF